MNSPMVQQMMSNPEVLRPPENRLARNLSASPRPRLQDDGSHEPAAQRAHGAATGEPRLKRRDREQPGTAGSWLPCTVTKAMLRIARMLEDPEAQTVVASASSRPFNCICPRPCSCSSSPCAWLPIRR